MFCGGFLQSKPAGRRAKMGLCGWNFARQRDCGGLPYLVVWDGDGLDFAGRQVFPILWYKGAAACAYYSLKRR